MTASIVGRSLARTRFESAMKRNNVGVSHALTDLLNRFERFVQQTLGFHDAKILKKSASGHAHGSCKKGAEMARRKPCLAG